MRVCVCTIGGYVCVQGRTFVLNFFFFFFMDAFLSVLLCGLGLKQEITIKKMPEL